MAIERKDPVSVYLRTLRTPEGRRTQHHALRVVASTLLGRPIRRPEGVAWHRIGVDRFAGVGTALRSKYRPLTVNRMLAALRGVVEWTWRLGKLDYEAYRRIKVSNVRGTSGGRGRRLDDEELQLLYAAVDAGDSDDHALAGAAIALMHFGGLRRREAADLQLADVNLSLDWVRVTGKGAKSRTVFMGEGLPLVRGWMQRRGDDPGPLLRRLDRRTGEVRALSGTQVYRLVERMARDAGLEDVGPHDLRRTCATRLLEESHDLSLVGRYLGHAKADTTRIYDARGTDELRALQARLKVGRVER